MNKTLTSILIVIFLAILSVPMIGISSQKHEAFGIPFSSTVNVSHDDGISHSEKILASGNNVYLVWLNGTAANPPGSPPMINDILFAKSTDGGSTFSIPIKISNAYNDDSLPPVIAQNGNNIYISWIQSNSGNPSLNFARSTDGGITFSNPIQINQNISGPQEEYIAANGNNVYIVFTNSASAGVFFVSSADDGISFTVPQQMSSGSNNHDPKILVKGTNVYLAWDDQNSGVYFRKSTDSGNTFGNPINISQGIQGGGTDIAISGNYVYATWYNFGVSNQILFARSTDDGNSFGNIITVSTSSLSGVYPQLAASGNNVYLTWQQAISASPSHNIDVATSSDNGNTFNFPVDISGTTESHSPQINATGNNVYLSWQGYHPNPDVFYSDSTDYGLTYSLPSNISQDNLAQNPQIAASGNYMHLAWQDNSIGNGDILVALQISTPAPVKLATATITTPNPSSVLTGNTITLTAKVVATPMLTIEQPDSFMDAVIHGTGLTPNTNFCLNFGSLSAGCGITDSSGNFAFNFFYPSGADAASTVTLVSSTDVTLYSGSKPVSGSGTSFPDTVPIPVTLSPTGSLTIDQRLPDSSVVISGNGFPVGCQFVLQPANNAGDSGNGDWAFNFGNGLSVDAASQITWIGSGAGACAQTFVFNTTPGGPYPKDVFLATNPTAPTGTVTWSSSGGGSFSNSGSCTLPTATGDTNTCTIDYTSPSTASQVTITAIYSGDSSYSGSSGTSIVVASAPPPIVSVPSATGAGLVTFSTSAGGFSSLVAFSPSSVFPTPLPGSYPFGFFSWSVIGFAPAPSVTITMTYPGTIPAGSQYLKLVGGTWKTVPVSISGNTMTMTISDNGPFDANPATGTISDPGGLALSTDGRASGGGSIGKNTDFTFAVRSDSDAKHATKGTLDYEDKSAKIKLHSNGISFLSVNPTMTGATFVGKGDLDKHKGDVNILAGITDPDKKGERDTFSITITDSTGKILYNNSGTVKGHIEIHKFSDHDDKSDSGIDHKPDKK